MSEKATTVVWLLAGIALGVVFLGIAYTFGRVTDPVAAQNAEINARSTATYETLISTLHGVAETCRDITYGDLAATKEGK